MSIRSPRRPGVDGSFENVALAWPRPTRAPSLGSVDGQLEPVLVDREQLTQVLVNLVQNGADSARARHGDHGGRVDVVLSPEERGVRIEVVDNGTGITDEDKERIFEPYFTTKSGRQGHPKC